MRATLTCTANTRPRRSFLLVRYLLGMDMFNLFGVIYVVGTLAAVVTLAWLVIAAIRALNAYTEGQRARTALLLAETAPLGSVTPGDTSAG